jgi:hypothetical protein
MKQTAIGFPEDDDKRPLTDEEMLALVADADDSPKSPAR